MQTVDAQWVCIFRHAQVLSACKWRILHILREASAGLLVRLRWAYARASECGTGDRYNVLALLFYDQLISQSRGLCGNGIYHE